MLAKELSDFRSKEVLVASAKDFRPASYGGFDNCLVVGIRDDQAWRFRGYVLRKRVKPATVVLNLGRAPGEPLLDSRIGEDSFHLVQ